MSTILGHKAFLNDGIMYFLMTNIVSESVNLPNLKYIMYDMYFGGTDGLRMFKDKLGFCPYWVKWIF